MFTIAMLRIEVAVVYKPKRRKLKMKKNKNKSNILKQVVITTILATTLFAVSTTTYAQPATASALSISMVNTNYNNKAEQANYKLVVDGVNKTSQVTFKVQNNRSMIGLRQFSNALGATVDWDTKKVAIVRKGSTTIEVPIGSKSILVNGTKKAIDTQGTVSIIVDSSTYLPFRIIAESLNYTVSYDQNTKTITCTSTTQAKPVEPLPGTLDLNVYYNKTNPDGTKFNQEIINRRYNDLKTTYKLTDDQAKTILDTMKSTAPNRDDSSMEYMKYQEATTGSDEWMNIQATFPSDQSLKGQYPYQPHPTCKGWYWNGNNWEPNAGWYYGM